jgi:hypothetical protein
MGLSLRHVAAALAGKALPLDGNLPGDKVTARQLIATGNFVNALPDGTASTVVPCVTMYQLLFFATYARSDVSACIKAVAGAGLDGSVMAHAQRGPAFEAFMAAWLRLQFALHAVAGHPLTLAGQWYVTARPGDVPTRVRAASFAPLALDSLACITHGAAADEGDVLEAGALHMFNTAAGGAVTMVVHAQHAAIAADGGSGGGGGGAAAGSAGGGTSACTISGAGDAAVADEPYGGAEHVDMVLHQLWLARQAQDHIVRELARCAGSGAAGSTAGGSDCLVHVHVAAGRQLVAPPDYVVDRGALARLDAWLHPRLAGSASDAPLSDASAAEFVAAMLEAHGAIVLDAPRLAVVLTPTLVGRGLLCVLTAPRSRERRRRRRRRERWGMWRRRRWWGMWRRRRWW